MDIEKNLISFNLQKIFILFIFFFILPKRDLWIYFKSPKSLFLFFVMIVFFLFELKREEDKYEIDEEENDDTYQISGGG